MKKMSLQYFKLNQDALITVYGNSAITINKDTILHIQDSYRSPLTGEKMVVVAMDKCTPVAIPANIGLIYD